MNQCEHANGQLAQRLLCDLAFKLMSMGNALRNTDNAKSSIFNSSLSSDAILLAIPFRQYCGLTLPTGLQDTVERDEERVG